MKRLLILLLFITFPALAQPAGKLSGTPEQKFAQAAKALKQRTDKAACEDEARKAQATAVKHPAKVTPYPVAYKKCMELRAK